MPLVDSQALRVTQVARVGCSFLDLLEMAGDPTDTVRGADALRNAMRNADGSPVEVPDLVALWLFLDGSNLTAVSVNGRVAEYRYGQYHGRYFMKLLRAKEEQLHRPTRRYFA